MLERLLLDSPNRIIYSLSPSLRFILLPSFFITIPSSSPIALNTFKTSASEAVVMSIVSSSPISMSSSSISSPSSVSSTGGISKSSSSSSSSSSPISMSSSDGGMFRDSSSTSSCSFRDSFTNCLISSLIVD